MVNPVPVLMFVPVTDVYGNEPESLGVPEILTASISPILRSSRLSTVIVASLVLSTPPSRLPNILISCPTRYCIP